MGAVQPELTSNHLTLTLDLGADDFVELDLIRNDNIDPNVTMVIGVGGAVEPLHENHSEVRRFNSYRKTSNKRLASNKSRPLIGAGCTRTLNLKNASNYTPLINACLRV